MWRSEVTDSGKCHSTLTPLIVIEVVSKHSPLT